MEVKLLYYISCFWVFMIYLDSSQTAHNECPVNVKLLCYEQKNCVDCIRIHPCCHWCYQTDFNGTSRCNLLEELSECGTNIEENKESSVTIIKDKSFTQISRATDAPDAIQIRPQSFKINLRPDNPVNLTFTYKAAKNYPLELYYLGDLSYSMKTHLETLKNLGDDLGRSLEKLTKHYRLAYGSFLDKPGMPFIYTDEENLKNPCQNNETCEAAYLFKHRLNFTNQIDRFFEEVKNSKISANVDDLDGALEAIFQILVCNERFGWSPYSRKMILLSTDSLLHIAGDGILAGATGANYKDLCLVNDEGDYTDPLKYDYPSVGQIKALLRSYKVNLIVAVTKDKINTYKNMKKDILEQEAFVGELQDSSRNILELVRTGFFNFIRQVDFSANASHAPELDVKFFGNCDSFGDFNVTSGCQNVEEEVPLTFKVQLTLKESTSKSVEHIYIREKNINEKIEISLNYVGCNCECPNYNTSNVLECVHGSLSCGSCNCEAGWQGATCSEECNHVPGACREDENSQTCNGRGDCECGKCICEPPYTGKYCQWHCPTNKYGIPCNGQGSCIEEKCSCRNGYTGDDCSCETSTDSCKLTGSDKICNGNGECECNRCKCYEGFRGTYCEIRKSSNDFCEMYESYVKMYAQNETSAFKKGEVDILVQELGDEGECDKESVCSVVYYSGTTQRCLLDYCYRSGENNTVHLGTKNKKCDVTAQAIGMGSAAGILFAILLGGGILILLKKWQIYQADKAEYKRFVEESKNFSEMNPLYKSPVTEFRNPMARNKN